MIFNKEKVIKIKMCNRTKIIVWVTKCIYLRNLPIQQVTFVATALVAATLAGMNLNNSPWKVFFS